MTTGFSRQGIFAAHPWLKSRSLTAVVGDDIDSLMCAVLMHHLFEWEIVGFYVDYSRVWYRRDLDISALREAVWLDLDISRESIRSVGHHILLSKPEDRIPAHKESVNPNLLRGVTGRPGRGLAAAEHGEACPCGGLTFPHKYPLGTIHFLLWLFDIDLEDPNDAQMALLWLPDSSWINGQEGRYRKNVLDWVTNWIAHPVLSEGVREIDTEGFERTMRDVIFPKLERIGFTRGPGQTTSRHFGLGGHQCQFADPNERRKQIQGLLDLIASTYRWSGLQISPGGFAYDEGKRNPTRYTLAGVRRKFGGLAEFVSRKRVFSYVIPNGGKINYTIGVPL